MNKQKLPAIKPGKERDEESKGNRGYMAFLALLLCGVSLCVPAQFGGIQEAAAIYSPTYNMSDIKPIAIDMAATGLVEIKGEEPEMLDWAFLYLYGAIFLALMALAVSIILFIPGKLKGKIHVPKNG